MLAASAAFKIANEKKNAKVALIERGILPLGPSTKNAGFACFGSITEIEKNRKEMSDDDLLSLLELRIKGLENLEITLGIKIYHTQIVTDTNSFLGLIS